MLLCMTVKGDMFVFKLWQHYAGSLATFSLSLLRRLFILHYSFVTLFLIKRGMLHHAPSIVISSPSILCGCYET